MGLQHSTRGAGILALNCHVLQCPKRSLQCQHRCERHCAYVLNWQSQTAKWPSGQVANRPRDFACSCGIWHVRYHEYAPFPTRRGGGVQCPDGEGLAPSYDRLRATGSDRERPGAPKRLYRHCAVQAIPSHDSAMHGCSPTASRNATPSTCPFPADTDNTFLTLGFLRRILLV